MSTTPARIALAMAFACAACSPSLAVQLSDERSADGEVARLLRLYQIRGAEVAQSGSEVRVWTKHDRDRGTLYDVRKAIDRIIAIDPVAPEPLPVLQPEHGYALPLRFVHDTGEIAIYGGTSMQPIGSHRFCVFEIDLGTDVPDVALGETIGDEAFVGAAHSLSLDGVVWETGARGLETKRGRGRFVFERKSQGPVEAQLAMTSEAELEECAEQVLAKASDDFIARAMFPRLVESAVSHR
ncbi:MAG TPA: hypothetical protein VG755_24470 [Nannocystaceae bacterium]|nr:hypothetical protein [Nannocystaceae bacterium]